MILNRTPITLGEVKDHVKDLENDSLHAYLKSFAKLSKADSLKCLDEIKALNNLKIKGENAIKIVDFLPKDAEELNKIFLDLTLTEEETNAILEIVKKY